MSQVKILYWLPRFFNACQIFRWSRLIYTCSRSLFRGTLCEPPDFQRPLGNEFELLRLNTILYKMSFSRRGNFIAAEIYLHKHWAAAVKLVFCCGWSQIMKVHVQSLRLKIIFNGVWKQFSETYIRPLEKWISQLKLERSACFQKKIYFSSSLLILWSVPVRENCWCWHNKNIFDHFCYVNYTVNSQHCSVLLYHNWLRKSKIKS